MTVERTSECETESKRGRGRPRLAPEERKKYIRIKKTDTRRRKAVRPPVDMTDKLQCSRCLVHLSKDKYKLKRSGQYYKNCIDCIGYMTKYRTILNARALKC